MSFLNFIILKPMMIINKSDKVKKHKKHNKAEKNYNDIICIMEW